MESSVILALVVVVLVGLKWLQSVFSAGKKGGPLPPGPTGLPIVGYLPFARDPPHAKFQELAKRYGGICSFYFGRHLVVLLNDFDVIYEAFVKQGDNFAGRPKSFPFKVFPDDEGIVTAEGAAYRVYKSFILSTLKDAGAVKASLELIVKDNVEAFLATLSKVGSGPVNVLEPLGLSVANTYCLLLLGRRCEYSSAWYKRLIGLLYRQQRFYANSPRIYLDWARHLPVLGTLLGETEMREITSEVYELLEAEVKNAELDYTDGSTKNFIHAWFTEEKIRKEKDPTETLFDRPHLIFNLNITFGAGYETTTTTILWGFLFLMEHPDVQEKVQREIDDVIGEDRAPSMADEPRMPYTQATIFEVHRYATIGPLGVPHRNKEDAVVSGYHIPKDSYVIGNFLAVHLDPRIYPEPETFNPERFLDDGGRFRKRQELLSFSIGRRSCPGEPLAQVEVFLYFAYILQRYDLVKPDGEPPVKRYRSGSLSCEPGNFRMRFVPRSNKNK